MDNKLRIKRVKEGIKLLENGIDPGKHNSHPKQPNERRMGSDWIYEEIGVSKKGCDILYINKPDEEAIKKGFKTGHFFDTAIMLDNWKRFLELIEKIK